MGDRPGPKPGDKAIFCCSHLEDVHWIPFDQLTEFIEVIDEAGKSVAVDWLAGCSACLTELAARAGADVELPATVRELN